MMRCHIMLGEIRKSGTNWQSIKNIVEEPLFVDSHLRKGLQIADAIVYCVNSHLNHNSEFDDYWNLIQSRMHRKISGSIVGYGLTIFPKEK